MSEIQPTPILHGEDSVKFHKHMEEMKYKMDNPELFPEFHEELKVAKERQRTAYQIFKKLLDKKNEESNSNF